MNQILNEISKGTEVLDAPEEVLVAEVEKIFR